MKLVIILSMITLGANVFAKKMEHLYGGIQITGMSAAIDGRVHFFTNAKNLFKENDSTAQLVTSHPALITVLSAAYTSKATLDAKCYSVANGYYCDEIAYVDVNIKKK